jgi:hypothetical protein
LIQNKNLKLIGDPQATLDARGVDRTLTLSGAKVRVAHLVVTGGRLDSGLVATGGGISAVGSHLTLSHVVVRGNRIDLGNAPTPVAAAGGGIYSDSGTLRIEHSRVKGNTARVSADTAHVFGGGIYRNLAMAIIGSTIEDNRAIAVSHGTGALSQGGGLLIDEGNLVIKSSTLSRNVAQDRGVAGPMTAEGGGIYFSDAEELTMSKTTVISNRASVSSDGTAADANGGGLAGALVGGTATRTRLIGNTAHADSAGDAAASGGAASLSIDNDLTFAVSQIGLNRAEAEGGAGTAEADGGGIDISDGGLVLRVSALNRNTATAPSGTATASGGGVATAGDTVVFRSTVSRNRASAVGTALGGGLYLSGAATATSVINSTVALNKALASTARGGGIDTFTQLDVTSSTVAANTAKIGGGLYREQGTTTLEATIVGANAAPDSPQCADTIQSNGHNLVGSTKQCLFAKRPSDLVKAPKLGKLGHHGGATETVPIGPGSPALDAISKAACPFAVDQRGVKRPQGNRCDIGAYERKR